MTRSEGDHNMKSSKYFTVEKWICCRFWTNNVVLYQNFSADDVGSSVNYSDLTLSWSVGLFLLSVRRSTQNWWRLCSPHRETPSSTSGWLTPSTSWQPAARRPPWTASRKWPSSRAWRSLWPMWAACSAWNNHWKPTPPPVIVLKSNQSKKTKPPASSLRTMGRRDGSKPVRNSVSLPAGIHLMPECRTCCRLLGFLFCFVFLPIHVTPGPALPSQLTDLMTMMWLPWRQKTAEQMDSAWGSCPAHWNDRALAIMATRGGAAADVNDLVYLEAARAHADTHTHTHTHTHTVTEGKTCRC